MKQLRLLSSVAGAMALVACSNMPPALKLGPVDPAGVTARAAGSGLVPVTRYDASIKVDQRYATAQNAFGRVLYPAGFPALASDPSARKLASANARLRGHGFTLLVWDAYRPPEAQWQLFKLFRSDTYVADPRKSWSKHCYGRAVDVTLADASGRPVPMPSTYDEFTPRAAAKYQGTDATVRRNLTQLQRAMTQAGFSIYPDEWWHFNDLSDAAVLAGSPVFGRAIGLPTK